MYRVLNWVCPSWMYYCMLVRERWQNRGEDRQGFFLRASQTFNLDRTLIASHSWCLFYNVYTCSVAITNESSMLQSLHFMKKIPPGAEAANILVGEVDFLNHPVVTFVRLLHPIILRDLTEVPVPTKFVFILLGPMGNQSKYHEIGRSIATLMSDEVRFLTDHALAELVPS